MGGGKGGGGTAPYQNELAEMFAGQNMLAMAQRNPYAASMFRPGSDLGNKYQDIFGTSALPEARPFRIDPLGAYSTAQSRVYGGAQPELNQPSAQPRGTQPGGNFGNMQLPPPEQQQQQPQVPQFGFGARGMSPFGGTLGRGPIAGKRLG